MLIYLKANRIQPLEITILLRQLATLIAAGIPIIQSLTMLEQSQNKPLLYNLVTKIKHDLLSGKNLFQCLKSHATIFDELTCQLIQIGETTGQLDLMLEKIASQSEKVAELKNMVKQALFYPAIIIFFSFCITFGMLIFVVPHFIELFKSTQITLPFLTVCIFTLSNIVSNYWWLIFILFIGGALIAFYSPYQFHIQKYCGFKKLFLARFVRYFGMTLAAGIPIQECLRVTANLGSSKEFTSHIYLLRRHLSAGMQLHQAMELQSYFPPLMIQMVKVGEECGMLEQMLYKIAEFYESDSRYFITRLSQLLEPLIMLVLGVLIGGLVIAMYLPIFKLGNTL